MLTSPVGEIAYDDGSYCIFLNAKFRNEYRSELPELCEYLDLISYDREIDEADYETRLGQKAAEGLKLLREDEKKRIAYMTFEQKLKDEAYYARQEGFAEGISQGEAKGLAEGLSQGEAKGAAEMRERLIGRLMAAQSLTREEAERILS